MSGESSPSEPGYGCVDGENGNEATDENGDGSEATDKNGNGSEATDKDGNGSEAEGALIPYSHAI